MSAPARPSAWRPVVLWPALVAALVFVNTLRNGFVYDDPIVLDWLKTRRWDLEGFLLETRGLTYAVHALDDWLWGSWPPGYHLTNIVLHSIACALAALTAWSLSGSRRVGIGTGLLFAVHPVHVEVVANVANRKDILALIFSLLGFLAWRKIDGKFQRLAATSICYALALYSKEVAAAGLVAMLFVGDVWLPDARSAPNTTTRQRALRSTRQLAPLLAGGLIAASIFSARLMTYFGAESIRKMSDGHYSTMWESLATSAANLTEFLRLLVFPRALSIDYALRPQASLLEGPALVGIALALTWMGLIAALYKRSRMGAFALLWVPVMFLPCSNLIPLHHIHVAERYLYVPSLGFCLAVALGLRGLLDALPARRNVILAGAALVLLSGGARSVVRNVDWRDVPALVAAADRDGIDTWRIHKTAGSWAIRNGDPQDAARRYARAAELRPGDPDLQFWKAVSASRVGDFESAVEAGRLATALRPRDPKAHYNLGIALIQTRDIESGASHLRRTVELEPEYAPAHYNLAVALSLMGDPEAAFAAFESCIAADPDHAEGHFNLGAMQAERGLETPALESLRRAVTLDPRNARFLDHLFATSMAFDRPYYAIQAGEVLAEVEPGRKNVLELVGDLCVDVGDLHRAIAAYRRGIDRDPQNVRLLEKAAATCVQAGQVEWARTAYRKVLDVDPSHERARAALEQLAAQKDEDEGSSTDGYSGD